MMGIKEDLLLWSTNVLMKGSGIANSGIKQNLQLAKELHRPIIRNFKRRTTYPGFKDNIWGVDLADMQSLSK